MEKGMQYGIAGLVLGVVLGVGAATYAVNSQMRGMMRTMGMRGERIDAVMMGGMMGHGGGDGMDMTMNEMRDSLTGKTGDQFDQAFIEAMIDHHQGAIEMAELAKQQALHSEITTLADAIIAAQTKEIGDMRDWARQWGYDLGN